MALTKTQRRINQLLAQDAQTDSQFDQDYREALTIIRDNLQAFYVQYADENGLSVTQTKQRINDWDKQQWQQAINSIDLQYLEDSQGKQMAKMYSYQAGLNLGGLIDGIIGLAVVGLYAKNKHAITQRIAADKAQAVQWHADNYDVKPTEIKQNYKRIAKNPVDNEPTQVTDKKLPNKPKNPHQNVASTVGNPEVEFEWSDKLWSNSKDMVNDIQNLVNKKLRSGLTDEDLADLFIAHGDPKSLNPKKSVADRVKQATYQADRIVRTESQRVETQTSIATFETSGVKELMWVTEPGACDLCIGFADNSPYPMGLLPYMPAHPNCRCHWEPVRNDQLYFSGKV